MKTEAVNLAVINQHARTHTQPFYGTLAFCPDYPGEPAPER